MPSTSKWLVKATINAIRQPKYDRSTSIVVDEYSAGWESYRRHLDGSRSMDDWLTIKSLEDQPSYCNVAGKLRFEAFDSIAFNRRTILDALRREFPVAGSVTEYGCGLGRNLLFLKREMPHLEVYGYELCRSGVEIAQAAAKKFDVDVKYAQLDYVHDVQSRYIHPQTDVAFTMYSLEQLPRANGLAVRNILSHVQMGSIHLEPVPEDYPLTYRGILGRLDHWKADYLRNFERNANDAGVAKVQKVRVDSAHNPLMFPSLYVLKKKDRS
jgi:SAM-dependent methyltransferase